MGISLCYSIVIRWSINSHSMVIQQSFDGKMEYRRIRRTAYFRFPELSFGCSGRAGFRPGRTGLNIRWLFGGMREFWRGWVKMQSETLFRLPCNIKNLNLQNQPPLGCSPGLIFTQPLGGWANRVFQIPELSFGCFGRTGFRPEEPDSTFGGYYLEE